MWRTSPDIAGRTSKTKGLIHKDPSVRSIFVDLHLVTGDHLPVIDLLVPKEMLSTQRLSLLMAWRSVSDLEAELFPVGMSLLGRQIVWELVRAHWQEERLSVKSLTLAVGGSENGTRRHLQRLEQAGLLLIREGRRDRRSLELSPSPLLLEAIERLLDALESAIQGSKHREEVGRS